MVQATVTDLFAASNHSSGSKILRDRLFKSTDISTDESAQCGVAVAVEKLVSHSPHLKRTKWKASSTIVICSNHGNVRDS
jgi:hypothetical protein